MELPTLPLTSDNGYPFHEVDTEPSAVAHSEA
jgi:hypothetical protein